MKKTLFKIARSLFWYALFDALVLGYAGFLPGMQVAAAQTLVPMTTLGAAITSPSTTFINLTSTTGITAGNTYLFIDHEFMAVNAVLNNGNVQVGRGYSGTRATNHTSTAIVFNGPATAFRATDPLGSCTRANELYLPSINVSNGNISDCLNGQWVTGDEAKINVAGTVVLNAATGGTIYTSVDGTGTAPGASTEMYCSELDLPFNRQLTGMAVLNGTSVATDTHQYELYDAGGNLLAKTASTAAGSYGSASEYGRVAFTSEFFAVGPAKYYTCFSSSGTTATVRMLLTQVNDFLNAGKLTGLVYGTVPATITPPNTFTTALGPYSYVY